MPIERSDLLEDVKATERRIENHGDGTSAADGAGDAGGVGQALLVDKERSGLREAQPLSNQGLDEAFTSKTLHLKRQFEALKSLSFTFMLI